MVLLAPLIETLVSMVLAVNNQMVKRAPRFENLQIPLTLHIGSGESFHCACKNISSSGALLKPLNSNVKVEQGSLFRCKLVQQGKLVEIWMQVERIGPDGFGVRFLSGSPG